MPSYSFRMYKGDHIEKNGTHDLHVHVYYNEGKSRKLLGRYRLPTLEPVFQAERELNNREIVAIRSWLAEEKQMRKLENFLKGTLFDLNKITMKIPEFADIQTDGGETYINVRIPVSRRIGA